MQLKVSSYHTVLTPNDSMEVATVSQDSKTYAHNYTRYDR